MGGPAYELFRVLAAITTLMMVLLMIPTVYRIHKTCKTDQLSVFPFIAMLANCHGWYVSIRDTIVYIPTYVSLKTNALTASTG